MIYFPTEYILGLFRCPCCGRVGIDGRLIASLEDLYDLTKTTMSALSTIRCQNWNRVCGGAKRSQHLLGRAADIVIQGFTVAEMADAADRIEGFHRGGIGDYPDRGFIHVDVRPAVARWTG